MKVMRDILIVLGLVSVLSVSAQSLAQQPTSDFRSTSTMVGTGSTLPQAAQTGAVLAGNAPSAGIRQPLRPGTQKTVDFEGGEPDTPQNPGDPLGDAVWPLMVLACAYLIIRVYRKRRA